jgi:MFS family permease
VSGETEGRRQRHEENVRYRDVLANREFRGMVLAQIASEAGDQIARVALALLVLDRTDSPLLAAATFAVSFLPVVVGGPLLGPLADRFSRRNLMLLADVGRAIGIALLALVAVPGVPLWVLFVLLVVAELFTPLFDSARAASIPDILGRPELVNAGLGLSRSLNLVNQAVGLLLGGAIVQLTGSRAALMIDAVSFVVSFAILFVVLERRPARLEAMESIGMLLSDMVEGGRHLFADPSRRAMVLLMWALAAPLAAPEAVALAYARGNGDSDVWGGALMGSIVVGAAIGAVLVARRPLLVQLDLMLPLAVVMSLPLLVTGIQPPIAVLVLLWCAAGAAQAFMIPTMAFLTLFTPNEQRGRVVGLAGAGFMALTAVGYLVAGAIATTTSPAFAVAAMASIALLIVAVIYLVWPAARLRTAVRGLTMPS